MVEGKRSHILSCESRRSKWHREIVHALSTFAASHEVTKEELCGMFRLKLSELKEQGEP